MKNIVFASLLLVAAFGCNAQKNKTENKSTYPVVKTEAEWKKILSPIQYEVMVKRGTERPFENPYYNNHQKGVYVSAATGDTLFTSDTKFESGTGWPSFWAPADKNKVTVVTDNTHGMTRDEVIETSTGLHLGHVFNDGPKPTGLRYCLNSAALIFKK